jgi:hypothetical protein
VLPLLLHTRQSPEDDGDSSTNYQLDMMRCLREVNVDNNTVGWYQSSVLGQYQVRAAAGLGCIRGDVAVVWSCRRLGQQSAGLQAVQGRGRSSSSRSSGHTSK